MSARAGAVCGVLTTAAELCDQRGLYQGDYWPGATTHHADYVPGDPCCLVGHVIVATGETRPDRYDRPHEAVRGAAIRAVSVQIHADYLGYWPDVTNWSDRPGRTRSEVVALLRRAAAAWRARQTGGA